MSGKGTSAKSTEDLVKDLDHRYKEDRSTLGAIRRESDKLTSATNQFSNDVEDFKRDVAGGTYSQTGRQGDAGDPHR